MTLWIDPISRVLCAFSRLIRWALLVLLITQLLIIGLRHGFSLGTVWMQELVWYSNALLFMFGVGAVTRANKHVRVDLFYSRWSARTRRGVDLFGAGLFTLPFCGFVIIVSMPYVMSSWQSLEGSRDVAGLPLIFMLKTAIPIFACLIALETGLQIARSISDKQKIGR